jgi:AcrR family transcriptional regulator
MQRNSTAGLAGKTGRQLARDKVFAVASDLFYRKGIHAVGVEEIVKEAGVAKISLYRNFASKDDLVVAYLDERRTSFLRDWDRMFDRHSDDPKAQLRAIMTYVAKRTSEEGYRGCPFINFSAEFPDPAHRGREIARETMRALRARFLKLAEALGVPEPKRLADGLLLLFEGAYGLSQTLGGGADSAVHQIVWASEMLVEAQFAAAKSKASRRERIPSTRRR